MAENSSSRSLQSLDEYVRAVETDIKKLVKQFPDEGLAVLEQRCGIQVRTPLPEVPAQSMLLASLPPEERDVAPLVLAGKTAKEIAALLGIKERRAFYLSQKLIKHLKCTNKAEVIHKLALTHEFDIAKD